MSKTRAECGFFQVQGIHCISFELYVERAETAVVEKLAKVIFTISLESNSLVIEPTILFFTRYGTCKIRMLSESKYVPRRVSTHFLKYSIVL